MLVKVGAYLTTLSSCEKKGPVKVTFTFRSIHVWEVQKAVLFCE